MRVPGKTGLLVTVFTCFARSMNSPSGTIWLATGRGASWKPACTDQASTPWASMIGMSSRVSAMRLPSGMRSSAEMRTRIGMSSPQVL